MCPTCSNFHQETLPTCKPSHPLRWVPSDAALWGSSWGLSDLGTAHLNFAQPNSLFSAPLLALPTHKCAVSGIWGTATGGDQAWCSDSGIISLLGDPLGALPLAIRSLCLVTCSGLHFWVGTEFLWSGVSSPVTSKFPKKKFFSPPSWQFLSLDLWS